MIGGQAFDFLMQCIADIYLFGTTHVAIRFGDFALTYWDLWTSFSAIVLLLHVILGHLFKQDVYIKIPGFKQEDDTI